MNADIAKRLITLNRQFYTDFGAEFSATRGRIQPGVWKIINSLKGDERILDLGCGNGELARTLAKNGHHAPYLGLDFSLPLLADAEAQPDGFSAEFRKVDLTKLSAFSAQLPTDWSLITSFATLHHIPSLEMRLDILRIVHGLLADDGRFVHSNWQFLKSARLMPRIQAWEEIGLTVADVDMNDYLLDWRSGGRGLRYVHHFDEAELLELAQLSKFETLDTFYSDGKEGNLAIYQTWQKIK